MGLIEEEIKELRQLMRDFKSGKCNSDHVNSMIGIFSQTEKRAKMMLQAYSLAAKHNTRHLKRLVSANLIGDGEAIDTTTGDPETEKVKCPGKDFELIERSQCLDWSGEQKFPECNGCEVGMTTKNVLLGRK